MAHNRVNITVVICTHTHARARGCVPHTNRGIPTCGHTHLSVLRVECDGADVGRVADELGAGLQHVVGVAVATAGECVGRHFIDGNGEVHVDLPQINNLDIPQQLRTS
jgi:hypothetical protein